MSRADVEGELRSRAGASVPGPVTVLCVMSLTACLGLNWALWTSPTLYSLGPYLIFWVWGALMIPAMIGLIPRLHWPPGAPSRWRMLFWAMLIGGVIVYVATPKFFVPDAALEDWRNGPWGIIRDSSVTLPIDAIILLASFTIYTSAVAIVCLVLGWLADSWHAKAVAW